MLDWLSELWDVFSSWIWGEGYCDIAHGEDECGDSTCTLIGALKDPRNPRLSISNHPSGNPLIKDHPPINGPNLSHLAGSDLRTAPLHRSPYDQVTGQMPSTSSLLPPAPGWITPIEKFELAVELKRHQAIARDRMPEMEQDPMSRGGILADDMG